MLTLDDYIVRILNPMVERFEKEHKMTKDNIINELRKNCPNWNNYTIGVILNRLELLGLIKFDQPKSKVDLIIEAWKKNIDPNWRQMAEIAVHVLEQK